jgi:hypothetical protein
MPTNEQFWIGASVLTALMAITPVYLLLTGEILAAVVMSIFFAIVLFTILGLSHSLMKT